MARRDETIRLMLEAEGAAEVQGLAKDVAQLGTASGEAAKQADKLLDEIADAGRLKQVAAQYRESVVAVRDYQVQMRAAAEAAGTLSAREKELSATEEKNRQALAAAKAELSAFTDGTRAFLGTTKQVKAAQENAREEVRRLTAEYKASVAARQQVTDELERERAAAVKSAAGREREIQVARGLRSTLDEAGVSVRNLSNAETQLAALAQAAASALRALAADTRAAATAAAEKEKADDNAARESAAHTRALEIQADAIRQIERAERDAARGWDASRSALESVDGALASQLQKLQRLRTQLEAAGISTDRLAQVERELADRARRASHEIDETAKATRRLKEESDRLLAEQTAATAAENRLIQARLRGRLNLEAYRKKVAETKAATEQLSRETDASIPRFSRLRTAIAGVFAGLSVRTLYDSVLGVLKLGDAAERTRIQFGQLYGSLAAGDAALAGGKKLAADLGVAWDGTRDAMVKLKAFGIDPLNGSLRALINENAAMGGSQERLEGIVLAMGQAWTKQKFQAEEALQLAERGVPVWDLLAKATGKSVPELLKLSEAGRLGRKEIGLLFAEIGKANNGAAIKNAGTLSGLFTQLTSRVRDFFTQVANSGTLDYFKQQLGALNQRIKEMAASGQLADLAKSISEGIVGTAKAIAGVVGFVRDYGEQLLLLARAYVVLKAAGAITGIMSGIAKGFNDAAKSAGGATTTAGKFGAALRGLASGPAMFAAITVAADFTVGQITKLISVTEEYFAVQAKLKQIQAETIDAQKRLAASAAAVAKQGNDALRVQLLGAEELNNATRTQLTFYIQALKNAAQEARRLKAEADKRGDIFGSDNMASSLAEFGKALQQAEAALEKVGSVAQSAGEFARKAAASFDRALTAGKNTALALAGIFEKLDLATPQGVKDLVETLNVLAPRARDARAAIEGELLVALEKLNGEQLRFFQKQASQAMLAAQTGARDAALVLDTVLGVALTRLGLSATQAGVAVTQTGRDIIATFQAVVENARATGAQIAQAFEAALAQVTTKEEAEALGQAIKRAGETGRIGLDQAKDAAAALALRIREITIAADPLADEFERLGIKSKAQLEATRDAAERAFQAIYRGAQRGKAAQDDVRAAFQAYIETARAAAAHSDAAGKSQVEAQLRAKASAMGLTRALEEVSAAGSAAGAAVAAGADQAADALDRTSGAASDAADSAGDLGANSDAAAAGLQNVANAGAQATEIALDLSAAFASAASSMEGLDRITFTVATEQQRQAQELLESLRQQNLQYDEQAQRLEQLRRQFGYLGDATLQQIAREQELLEQNQKRRQDQQRQQENASTNSGGGAAGGVIRVQVEVKGGGGIKMEDLKNRQLAEDLVRAIQPAMNTLAKRGLQFPGG